LKHENRLNERIDSNGIRKNDDAFALIFHDSRGPLIVVCPRQIGGTYAFSAKQSSQYDQREETNMSHLFPPKRFEK